jgi:hypothetical protein
MSSNACCSRAVKGWLAGSGATTAVLFAFGVLALAIGFGVTSLHFVGGIVALLFPSLLIFVVTCLITGFPAAFVIWLSEKFRIRSILFFGCLGSAIGVSSLHLLVPLIEWPFYVLFLVAGFAAGLAYWFVAGKYAGRDRHLPSR